MDADEAMEEKDCCILIQDFFCTPDYITPKIPQVAYDLDDDKENIPCLNLRRSQQILGARDCSPNGLESRDFSFDLQITPVQLDCLIQLALQKRGGYVSQSAVALRCATAAV